MEKTVRILEQSALSTRKYTDKKSGQEKVMNAVTFKLTDGAPLTVRCTIRTTSTGCSVQWL